MLTTIATQKFAAFDHVGTGAPEVAEAAFVPAPTFIEEDQIEAVYEADVLVQLKANLAQLDDLHGRMQFMMNELSYLLVRKS